jgi:hypothetical protein
MLCRPVRLGTDHYGETSACASAGRPRVAESRRGVPIRLSVGAGIYA